VEVLSVSQVSQFLKGSISIVFLFLKVFSVCSFLGFGS